MVGEEARSAPWVRGVDRAKVSTYVNLEGEEEGENCKLQIANCKLRIGRGQGRRGGGELLGVLGGVDDQVGHGGGEVGGVDAGFDELAEARGVGDEAVGQAYDSDA